MQYILTELEFQDYQRLKLIENSLSGDAVKVDQFLSALARLQLSDWQLVLGRIPEDVLEDVGKLHQRSEQQLLKIWQDKDADFYGRMNQGRETCPFTCLERHMKKINDDYKNDPNHIPSGPLAVQKKFSELVRGDVVEIQGARRLTVSEPPELVEGSQFWRAEVVEHSAGLVRLFDDDVWVVDVRLVDLNPIGF